jgi:hypothetical protein
MCWRVLCVVFILVVNEDGFMMAQEKQVPENPAVDQFTGYYNIPYREIYRGKNLTESKKREFHFSVPESEVPRFSFPEMTRLMTRLDSLSKTFEPPKAADIESSSNITTWQVSGRTLALAFYDNRQINQANCELIRELLKSEFPLWRIGIAVIDQENIPLVYPSAIVVPSKWQTKREEYWKFIIERENESMWDLREGWTKAQKALVEEEIKAILKRDPQFQPQSPVVIKMFEYSPEKWPNAHSMDIWVLTDNPPIDTNCYLLGKNCEDDDEFEIQRKFFEKIGYTGGNGMMGVTHDGLIKRCLFSGSERDREFSMRVFRFCYRLEKFDAKNALINNPTTGNYDHLLIPDDFPVLKMEETKRRYLELIHNKNTSGQKD